jgi:hypothetical protein
MRTYDGIPHDTFHAACLARGLLENDDECHRPLGEACVRMPSVRSSPRGERIKVGRVRVSAEYGLGPLRVGLE